MSIPNTFWKKILIANVVLGGVIGLLSLLTIDRQVAEIQSAAQRVASAPPVVVTAKPASSAPPPSAPPSTFPESVQTVSPPARAATPFDALLAQAISVEEFEKKLGQDSWAFYPPNTKDCGGGMRDDGTEFDERLDVPDTENEFERQRKQSAKASIQQALMGTLVKLEKTERVEPTNYNFKMGTFTLKIGNTESFSLFSSWPFPGGEPKFVRESELVEGKVDTGLRIGGERVERRGSYEMAHYINVSHFPVTVSVEPSKAESWSSSGVELTYAVVQRFKGLGFHRRCKYSCASIFGMRTCGNDNEGAGKYYRTEAVAHRVTVDGVVVAEKI